MPSPRFRVSTFSCEPILPRRKWPCKRAMQLEVSRQFLTPESEHPHLVLCAVSSQARLLAAADHLFRNEVRFTLFREPDRGDEATALATEPLAGARCRLMERFRCLQIADFQSHSPEPERNHVML